MRQLYTSESVTEGHPDKVADQISDAVLDAHLALDPMARVACETFVTPRKVILAGEITASGQVDYTAVVRRVLAEIGYTAKTGFDGAEVPVEVLLQAQSPDIAQGVDSGGAGDQGLMYGFACAETPEAMPAPIAWAHALAKRLSAVRKQGVLPYLRPDGKTQVTVAYDGGQPVQIETVVVSSHHAAYASQAHIRADIVAQVVEPVLGPTGLLTAQTQILVNPTGAFTVGGPAADVGLTGRKIIVDTYGGLARHGGGAFSGKDPTKVDRSAAYMLRYVAKHLVAAGFATRVELQVSYAIGRAHPVNIAVETFGTGTGDPAVIAAYVAERFDLTPAGIITTLDLRRPQYQPLAAYGHMGREELGVRWELVSQPTRQMSSVG
jgi:S-adenosylmethionine synthetase